MSGPSYNVTQPSMPSYGEGMADALKAQVELLKGTGDFAGTGGLAGLLPLERDVRELSAQMDTDILRQTLLGSTKEETVSGTFDDEGRLVIGEREGTPEKRQGKPLMTITKYPQGGGKYKFDVVFKDPFTNRTISSLSKIDPPNNSITNEFQLIQAFESGNAGQYNNAYNKAQQQAVFEIPGDPVPIYGKDAEGKLIVDKSRVGETAEVPISSKDRAGMIDLLGDQQLTSDGRKPGFSKEGEFLGLSALAEDIQRGNLSRQRDADLADVENLSERFQDVMEDYKPAATSGLDDARILLEQQRENLTGLRKATQADVDQGLATQVGEMFQTGTGSGGPVTVPTTDTFGGEVTAATMDAAQVADPLQLQANTQFQGELATGADNQDTLRSNLLGDAKTALDTGLTDREQAQIANAARARQTLMGRTFDQSGAIAEAEARVQEDNARRMQNRAFAQSVLGQEAGLQQGDITRGMAQESEQAGLQQRTDLAQAQMDQQANAFGAQSTQQARMANQAQRQQANQFGVGATMDAERLNETLRQQGLSNYINAVGNLAQMEDQYMLDPFQALLGRGGGNALQQGQSVFGQANYGLSSGPQYLNPEAGLGYISNMAANQANMYAANVAADASRGSGLMSGIGAIGGGLLSNPSLFCWVAREVYGPTNPAWLQFREWMFTESPQWFFELYRKYGERFASWISDKPRLKAIIRKWMDSKIGDK